MRIGIGLKTRRLITLLLVVAALCVVLAAPASAAEYTAVVNADVQRLEEYTVYGEKNPGLTPEQVVTNVNIGLGKSFYSGITPVDVQADSLILVNKYHDLPQDYRPDDLVTLDEACTQSGVMLRSEAAVAFEELSRAAATAGLHIYGFSGYRSYKTQEGLYQKYLAQDGVKVTDTYSARAGFSEHQTGLAIDVTNSKVAYTSFADTDEYAWVRENIHRFGFIQRYTREGRPITGYKAEAWHLRYVGRAAAEEIYRLDVTLEEYLDRYVYPTGVSTFRAEQLDAATVRLSGPETATPYTRQTVDISFDGMCLPIIGSARWEVDGVPVSGYANPQFTLGGGNPSRLSWVMPGKGERCEVAFVFVPAIGGERRWTCTVITGEKPVVSGWLNPVQLVLYPEGTHQVSASLWSAEGAVCEVPAVWQMDGKTLVETTVRLRPEGRTSCVLQNWDGIAPGAHTLTLVLGEEDTVLSSMITVLDKPGQAVDSAS